MAAYTDDYACTEDSAIVRDVVRGQRIAAQAQTRASAGLGGMSTLTRPLDEISIAADRVESAASRIADFVHRFHGEGPVCRDSASKTAPPCGYSGQINRLTRALSELEENISALTNIG